MDHQGAESDGASIGPKNLLAHSLSPGEKPFYFVNGTNKTETLGQPMVGLEVLDHVWFNQQAAPQDVRTREFPLDDEETALLRALLDRVKHRIAAEIQSGRIEVLRSIDARWELRADILRS